MTVAELPKPKLEGSMLRRGGAKDPAVLAAYIGRKKNSRAPDRTFTSKRK